MPFLATCRHCGLNLFAVIPTPEFCPECGHEPAAALTDCCCRACVRLAVPDLLEVADEGAPVQTPAPSPEGGAA